MEIINVTCWESPITITGSNSFLQMHHMSGKDKSLSFIANNLRPNLNGHLAGKLAKIIQSSAMMIMSGLKNMINPLRANLEGELAKPLIFQKRHFVFPFWKDQPLTWFHNYHVGP